VLLVAMTIGTVGGAPASGQVDEEPALALRSEGFEPRRLEAEIRRTEHGIPHIKAEDWAGLGYGYGYAFAQDNLCLLAEMVVTANAQRSLLLGASDANLREDLFHQQLIDLGVIERSLAASPDAPVPGPSQRVRDLVEGTAAGYNRHLRDIGGPDGIADPACAGADWVREIDDLDLWRTYLDSSVRAGRGALATNIVSAQPPGAGTATAAAAGVPAVADTALGSNAYGLGREATASGSGMLLGNPHFPWQGRDRFYEMHLTIPGEYDMIGAALSGQPVVEIGHNESMGWSHTVSTARRFTLFELQLVPGDPTRYYLDGEEQQMTSQTVEVEVADASGQVSTVSRTLWSTVHGPIVAVSPLEWTETTAYALRDVNEDAGRTFDGYIEMGRSTDVRELKATLDRWQHLPWINTIAADSTGEAFYGDHSVVPNVSNQHLENCVTPVGRIALAQLGVFILDGGNSDCQWQPDPSARVPGIIGPSRLPTIFRDDYVTNSNDSYWLTNPEQPLEGFDRIIGVERTARSLRTRLGILQVQERLAGTDGLEGQRFTLEQLQEVMFSNRVLGAELAVDALVGLCRAQPEAVVDGEAVDLTAACEVLARWDRRVDLESRGAHLFREFVDAGGLVWAVPFDVTDPVGTPNTLDVANPAVLESLGEAVVRLTDAGIPLDAPLGEVQGEPRGDRIIPIHGGTGGSGAFNVISAPFRGGAAYRDVQSGASFILAAEFTPEGPRSRAILSYSNSTDPTSPHSSDQTELYARKQWVDLDYREADILADPALTVTTIEEPLPTVTSIDTFCAAAGPEPFEDTAASTFVAEIECLFHAGLTSGVGAGGPGDTRPAFAPEATVSRQQMASFIVNLWDRAVALDRTGELVALPAADSAQRFTDVRAGDVHAANINRLAAVGVVDGGPGGRPASEYGPTLPVTREQMASFIVRTLEALLDEPLDAVHEYFIDTGTSVHRDTIDVVAEAGIAIGDGFTTFRPGTSLTRGQMSAFLVRTLAALEALDIVAPAP
jgi:acyl-homoserine-lactone acylase